MADGKIHGDGPIDHEHRAYQKSLMERAKRENIIVCLPTGAGKTFIAVELTKHYLIQAEMQDKVIVFVATTVPLVLQQASYFKQHLSEYPSRRGPSVVREIKGDANGNVWNKPAWEQELRQGKVFFMTSEILRLALDHGLLAFSKLCLLILDECHHAGKDHPMSKIMQKYESLKKDVPDYDLPRVIGLTATIIRGDSYVGDIEFNLRDIETRLCCKAVTYHDYKEVLPHSTKASISLRIFSSVKMDVTAHIIAYLNQKLEHLKNFEDILRDTRKLNMGKVDHSTLKSPAQMYNKKKKSLDEFTNALTGVKKVCDELGPYAAHIAALLKMIYLKSVTVEAEDKLRSLIKMGTETALTYVITKINHLMASELDKSLQIERFVSGKVSEVFKILLEWKERGDAEKLCGIVFCTERLSAQILTIIFQNHISASDKFGFIKPAFVVGSGRTQYDIIEQRTTAAMQKDVIESFRRKELNLIFATNVLEEGLDVPSCNLIIRFDPFVTYPSFVQSMGRARQRDALFYVLSSVEGFCKAQMTIDKYVNYNSKLVTHLKDWTRHLEVNVQKKDAASDPDEIKPLAIDPSDPDSPKVTLTDAVSLVNRYCQTLAFEGGQACSIEPISWWTKVKDGQEQFVAFIKLPPNAIVQGVIQGSARGSKNEAKRVAYLEVCKQLYAKGALDDQLFPHRRPQFLHSVFYK